MSETHIVGKVAMTFRGAYDANASYEKLDVITYNGTSYGVLQACTGVTPPNATYYQVLAQKGIDGQNGSAATVAAGTVTMLPVGSAATVSNSGTSSNAIFNFGIPKESFDTSIIAEDFDSASGYVAGDYCVYNGSLYRFTADKSAGGWNGSFVEQVVACDELNKRIEKETFNNAGIYGESFTTIYNTSTVTTSQYSSYPSYHALLVDGREASRLLEYNSNYRITFDNVEYVLSAQGWYVAGMQDGIPTSHDIVILGNIKLWGNDIGYYDEIPNVPFLITQQTDALEDYGIHLFTTTGGSHTIKIERISYNTTVIPNILMYGETNPPIFSMYGDPTYKDYNSLSIGGYNDLRDKRTTVAIGSKNIISGANAIAIGQNNDVGGVCATAIGSRNTASGFCAVCVNEANTSSGRSTFTANAKNTASGLYASAFGYNCVSSGAGSMAIGGRCIANHKSQFVFGYANVPDPSTSADAEQGTYIEIVGNGTNDSNRSNARTLDWSGNESLTGSITLGKGTADEVTLTAQQLTRLLDDTSIIAEDFDSASGYVAGDYCVYNGSLYRFTADKSAGSWNSSVVEQVAVCVELNNRLEKSEFNRVNTNGSPNYAGIHSETYVTEVNTTSVTTASLSGYPSYVATILEQDNPDALYRGYMYRITFDGVEYILPCLEWFIAVHVGTQFVSSTFPIIGNVTLFNSSAGFYTENANVPFLISGLISTDSDPKDEGIFLFTQTSGAHTVKIERIEYAYTMLPEYTMYGATIRPIYRQKDTNTAYPVFSIGTNNLENRRNCFAIGNCNTISSNGYMAIGSANTVSGNGAIAMGTFNTASGQYSRTFGSQSTASGNYAESHGAATTASGQMSTTHGYRTTANHKSQFVFGEFNTPDPSTATASSRGNYVEIVGNGTAVSSTSNARTLDWQGNESLAGGLTLGMGTANEVSITAQQLQQLLALLN